VEQAAKAFSAGYAPYMLEISPDSPLEFWARTGGRRQGRIKHFSQNGCGFLKNGLCELHGTGLMPLECRFCHHDRIGRGKMCHLELEKDWNTTPGQILVRKWIDAMQLHAWQYRGGQ
jgi:hypothetical protein